VFGIIKSVPGFPQFSTCAQKKATGEPTPVCLVKNLKRMAVLRLQPGNPGGILRHLIKTQPFLPARLNFSAVAGSSPTGRR